jgi:hypothetical protein
VVGFAGKHKNRIGVLRLIYNQKLSGIRNQPRQRQQQDQDTQSA